MAGKRKAKRTTAREDLSKPSRWRLQHGGFDEAVRGTDPDTGTPILHRRAVDSLGVLLANGSITLAGVSASDLRSDDFIFS